MAESIVKSMASSIIPNANEKKAEVEKSVEILKSACESKIKLFETDIEESYRNNSTSFTLPINSIVRKTTEFICTDESQINDILTEMGTQINELIEGFTSGKLVEVIASAVTELLAVFFGETSATVGESEKLMLFVENDVIVRYDVRVCNFDVSSSTIETAHSNYYIVVLYKAIVDISKVSFNTFLYYYDRYDGTRYFKADSNVNDPSIKPDYDPNNDPNNTNDSRTAIIGEKTNFINRINSCWDLYKALGGEDKKPDINTKYVDD